MSITNTPFPVLIFVRGLPGSGKSYVTNRLQKELGEGVVVLDPDATDYESNEYHEHTKVLTEQGVNPALFAYRFLREKAYKAIKENKVVIWNQPFTNLEIFNKMIANLRIKADEHQVALPILVVEVEIDSAVAKKRVAERKQTGGHGPSDTTFSRFVNDYKSFKNEGFETVTVQGDDDIDDIVKHVIGALNDLLKNLS